MMRGISRRICLIVVAMLGAADGRIGYAADTFDATKTPVDIAIGANANIELLNQLRLHDAALDNRTLEIEKRWTETIVPLAELMQLRRRDPAAAANPIDMENIPPTYQQPHRLRYRVTYRGPEHTMRIIEDLEPRINKEFGSRPNAGFVWSNADGELTDYSPATGMGHKQTSYTGNILSVMVRSFQWSCGFGYGKWITAVETIHVRDQTTVLFGTMRLLNDDETRCTIYLDQDWIVRKAIVSIPSRQGGSDGYVVITEGTVSNGEAPPLAKSGRYRRILRPQGKKFSIDDDYAVSFAALSRPLSDEQYAAAIKLEIPPRAIMVDMRKLLQP